MEDSDAELHLMRMCDGNDIGFEDWSSVRVICAAQSGALEQHHCSAIEDAGRRKNYGFGFTSREVLVQVLSSWEQALQEESVYREAEFPSIQHHGD
jgi:hypothetical protein